MDYDTEIYRLPSYLHYDSTAEPSKDYHLLYTRTVRLSSLDYDTILYRLLSSLHDDSKADFVGTMTLRIYRLHSTPHDDR